MGKAKAIVFLDVDGVLNTRRTCERAPSEKYVGIDEARVALLSNAMKQTRMEGVVLTTTWKDLREDEEDYIYLVDKLKKYDIPILGKTIDKRVTKREDGILQYLKEHAEIEEFVILDDQHYGFEGHRLLWENFIETKERGIESGVAASKTPSISAILFLDAIKEFA